MDFSKYRSIKTPQRELDGAASKSNLGAHFKPDRPVEFFQLQEGVNIIDIVPFKITSDRHVMDSRIGASTDSLWFRYAYSAHRQVHPQMLFAPCSKDLGGQCDLCQYALKQYKAKEISKDEFKELMPKARNLFWVLDHRDEQLKVWDASYYLFFAELQKEFDAEEEAMHCLGLDNGQGVSLKIRGNKAEMGQIKFMKPGKIDVLKERLNPPVYNLALKQVYDLGKYVVYPGPNLLKYILGENGQPKTESVTKPLVTTQQPTKPLGLSNVDSLLNSGRKCPYSGTFGVTFDKLQECSNCDYYVPCRKKRDANTVDSTYETVVTTSPQEDDIPF